MRTITSAFIGAVLVAAIAAPAFAGQSVTTSSMTGKPCREGTMGNDTNDGKAMAIGFATGQRGVPIAHTPHCRIPIDVQRLAIQFATGQHGMSMKTETGPCAGMEGMGVVTSVSDGAITLQHEAVAGMPAMVMTFDASAPSLLSGLAAGDSVRFHLKASGDHYVIDQIAKL